MSRKSRKAKKKRSHAQERAFERRMRRIVPSIPWLEATTGNDPVPYPPPANTTPPTPCTGLSCLNRRGDATEPPGRLYPAQYVQVNLCEDCRAQMEEADRLRRQREEDEPAYISPMAVVTEALETYGIHLLERRLLTESTSTLKAQIERYKATGKLPADAI
jgi:hypothetical protein